MSKTQLIIKQVMLGILVVVTIGIYMELVEANHGLVRNQNVENWTKIQDIFSEMSEQIRQSEEHLTSIDELLSDGGE